MLNDTIAAIATPLGEGGIGIIKVSGEGATAAVSKIFKAKGKVTLEDMPSFSLRLGHIVDSKSAGIVDEVLLSVMRAPRSYTGEDVVEINCHGGPVVLEKILQLVLLQGVRMAEPGEFTRRAFLNGRIDLVQAEAVIDVIRAKTDGALSAAVNQLEGHLSTKIKELQTRLMSILAQMEASIDFPEDVGDIDYAATEKSIADILQNVNKMIDEGQQGKVLREGLKTVIIGRPNVGKSSLLNALLRENRAIVTEIPGTTRDIIEEIVNIKGIPLKIADTAGIRETHDLVEKIGVDRAREMLEQADLILFILDVSLPLTKDDRLIANQLAKENTIVLLNKSDLGVTAVSEEEVSALLPGFPVIKISAKEHLGLENLAEAIKKMVFGGKIKYEREMVTRSRHLNALRNSAKHLQETACALQLGNPVDLIAIDVKAAWENLGEITGETIGDDILDTIFKDFCIGK